METIARCLSNDEILTQFHDKGALAKLILAIKTSLGTQTGEECGIYFSDFIFEMNKSHKELSSFFGPFLIGSGFNQSEPGSSTLVEQTI